MEITKLYNFHLPVWKQGDDLAHHLEATKTPAEAFEALAQQYEAAAAECRLMAAVAPEVPEMKVSADTHMIMIETPSSPGIEKLVQDEVLQEEEEPGGEYAD